MRDLHCDPADDFAAHPVKATGFVSVVLDNKNAITGVTAPCKSWHASESRERDLPAGNARGVIVRTDESRDTGWRARVSNSS